MWQQGQVFKLKAKSVDRSPLPDSNRRPPPYHGGALPTELRGRSSEDSRLPERETRFRGPFSRVGRYWAGLASEHGAKPRPCDLVAECIAPLCHLKLSSVQPERDCRIRVSELGLYLDYI